MAIQSNGSLKLEKRTLIIKNKSTILYYEKRKFER